MTEELVVAVPDKIRSLCNPSTAAEIAPYSRMQNPVNEIEFSEKMQHHFFWEGQEEVR